MLAGVTPFLPEEVLSLYDNLEFLIRILLSSIMGLFIGLERTRQMKEAGIRTHCIIAMASAAFMILSKYAFLDVPEVLGSRGADSARIAAQVVSGISFIGAGVIFKYRNATIKGLTTAAGIWSTAAVGMAIGAGMYWVGVTLATLVILSQLLLHRFPLFNDALIVQTVSITMKNTGSTNTAFQDLIDRHNGRIEQSEIDQQGDSLHIRLTIRLSEPISHADALALVGASSDIYYISI